MRLKSVGDVIMLHCGHNLRAPSVRNQHSSQWTCQQHIDTTGIRNSSMQIRHLLLFRMMISYSRIFSFSASMMCADAASVVRHWGCGWVFTAIVVSLTVPSFKSIVMVLQLAVLSHLICASATFSLVAIVDVEPFSVIVVDPYPTADDSFTCLLSAGDDDFVSTDCPITKFRKYKFSFLLSSAMGKMMSRSEYCGVPYTWVSSPSTFKSSSSSSLALLVALVIDVCNPESPFANESIEMPTSVALNFMCLTCCRVTAF